MLYERLFRIHIFFIFHRISSDDIELGYLIFDSQDYQKGYIQTTMKRRSRRVMFVSTILILISLLFVLFIQTFSDNLLFYRSPSQIKAGNIPDGYIFRVGGVVLENSIIRYEETTKIDFIITDFSNDLNITYTGILPDLFREGQGVVMRGKINNDGIFVAEEVLAKHDETYMPPELTDSLQINESEIERTSKSIR